MRYGICTLSVVPMRATPSHESETVSELLFNDIYEIVEDNGEWIKIRCLYDLYEGWIRRLQHQGLSQEELSVLLSKEKYIVNQAYCVYKGKILSFGSKIFEPASGCIPHRKTFDKRLLIESALKLRDIPYRWGGKSIMGIDCSAYVQLCAKVAGCKLPRDASQQVCHGKTISTLSEAQAGDIAFFSNEDKRITHVGILLDGNSIIHASGKVRTDRIDDEGIYNEEQGEHTHHLSIIKRLS